MSIFQLREWWAATPGATEEFGEGGLAVGNLDNAADGATKIATGSFSGMLRFYNPRQRSYNVEDLMLESQLDAPILQLASGHFLSDSNRVSLAVLHPRSIAVHVLSAVASSAGSTDASYFKLAKTYELELERPAFNMVHGIFGGSYGHDQILVQSMDGMLTIVDQERITVERKLGKFLLPGPLVYSPKADCFVTYTSRMEVECYKYTTVSSSKGGQAPGAKLHADWSFIVGEEVISIEIARLCTATPPSEVDVFLVAAHTLLALSDTGAIRNQRRLDYSPLCSATFPANGKESQGGQSHLIVGDTIGVCGMHMHMPHGTCHTHMHMANRTSSSATRSGCVTCTCTCHMPHATCHMAHAHETCTCTLSLAT